MTSYQQTKLQPNTSELVFRATILSSHSSTKMAPLPVVLCGKNPNIAKIVADGLLPEFEGMGSHLFLLDGVQNIVSLVIYAHSLTAIHVITSAPAGAVDLPILLAGNTPPDHSENVGSQNYANPPVAIAAGGGYTDEEFYSMHTPSNAVKEITWLKTDNSLLKAGVGPPKGDALVEYAKKKAVDVKKQLLEIGVGKEGVKGGIHLC